MTILPALIKHSRKKLDKLLLIYTKSTRVLKWFIKESRRMPNQSWWRKYFICELIKQKLLTYFKLLSDGNNILKFFSLIIKFYLSTKVSTAIINSKKVSLALKKSSHYNSTQFLKAFFSILCIWIWWSGIENTPPFIKLR